MRNSTGLIRPAVEHTIEQGQGQQSSEQNEGELDKAGGGAGRIGQLAIGGRRWGRGLGPDGQTQGHQQGADGDGSEAGAA